MPLNQTANFTTGGPNALQQQALAQEQMMLLARLKEQQDGLAPPVTNSGRLNVLNLEGLANAFNSSKTEGKLEVNRKKQADLLGAHQQALLEELARYDPKEPGATRRALVSGNPELRKLAEIDQKDETEREKQKRQLAEKLLERASFASGQQMATGVGGAEVLRPRENQTVANGMVVGTAEGAPPRVIAGKRDEPAPIPGVGMAQRNPFTGEIDQLDKAPKTSVQVSSGQKAGDAFLVSEAQKLSARAEVLRNSLPNQLSTLARAEETAASGAMQGPVSNVKGLAAGLAQELGVSSPEVDRLLANKQTLDSDMGKFVLDMVRALGANPSNADREYAAQIAGTGKLSSAGLQAVIRAAKATILTEANTHNANVERASQDIPYARNAMIRLPKVVNGPRTSADEVSLPGYTLSSDGRYVRDFPGQQPANPAIRSLVDRYLKPGN